MFEKYFEDLGFSKNEAMVFKALFTLGTKPASIVSKYLGMERTSVYKILQRLTNENLVYETYKGGIKHFFIPNIDILKNYTEKKAAKFESLNSNFENMKQELLEFENSKDKDVPKITLFDSNNGVKNIHEDIINNIEKNKFISIKLFASNTIDSQVNINTELKDSTRELFENLQEKKVSIETFLGNGIMIMENVSKTFDIETISKIPASNSAINIFLVGNTIYILIFKESSFGIKIESDDLAGTFHFLFDHIEVKK